MKRKSLLNVLGSTLVVPTLGVLARAGEAASAAELSAADRMFVAKVSQGGMFEVEAAKVATQKAVAQDVVDVGITEAHDHRLVGAKLKSIATSLGLPFPSTLDAAFAQRLDRLRGLSGAAFDDAFISEMDAIHAIDVKAFAVEAEHGNSSALKAFAAETVLIVRRHIGALHAVPPPAK